MKAMILAAGEGTRLRPLTLSLPKPMIPIANTPLLVRTLRLLAARGLRDVALNLHHRPDAIRETLGDGSELGLTLHYSVEEQLLGTAGGVKRMEPFLDETFMVLYGDNLWQADFDSLLAFHREKGATATIATFKAANPSACGLVITDEQGRVTRFQEKPPPEEVFTDTANAGVYVLEPEIFEHIPPDTACDFGKDIFPKLLDTGIIYACSFTGYLQDTGTPDTYRQANWDVLSGKTGGVAEAPGGLLVGPDARVAAEAWFEGANILGTGVSVEAGAHLSESILWDGCRIGAGARLTRTILGHRVFVGKDAVIGDGALLADDAHVAAGSRVPGGTRIAPGETFTQRH